MSLYVPSNGIFANNTLPMDFNAAPGESTARVSLIWNPGAPPYVINDIVNGFAVATGGAVSPGTGTCPAGVYAANMGGIPPYDNAFSALSVAKSFSQDFANQQLAASMNGAGNGNLWNIATNYFTLLVTGPGDTQWTAAIATLGNPGAGAQLPPATMAVSTPRYGVKIDYTGVVHADVIEGSYILLRAPDAGGVAGAYVPVAILPPAPASHIDPAPAGVWWYQMGAYDTISGATSWGKTIAGAGQASNGWPLSAGKSLFNDMLMIGVI